MVLLPGRPGAGREELLGRNDLFEDFARRNARDAELGVGRKVAVVNQLENIAALPVKKVVAVCHAVQGRCGVEGYFRR